MLSFFLIVLGLVGLLLALEALLQARDRRRFPPPGTLVDVGGYRLHLHCMGDVVEGQPTVVLEGGRGSSAYDWTLVQREIAGFARVCSYDRAGYGWSEPGPPPRSGEHLADELHRLLLKAGEPGPYLLVAHSHGAHTARLFARRQPDAVAGMVLLDARPDDIGSLPVLGDLDRANRRLRLVPLLARLGLIRAMGRSVLPPPFRERLPHYPVTVLFQGRFFAALNREARMTDQTDAQVRSAGSLHDLPLIVIRHGIPDLFADLDAERAQQAEAQWCAAQDRLAALSSQGRVRVAEHSGHHIMIEQPELVVEAVREILALTAPQGGGIPPAESAHVPSGDPA